MSTYKKCKVDTCERKVRANGYCDAHNQQIRRFGKIKSKNIQYRDGDRICKVEGCNRKHNCKGFCEAHYKQMVTHGNIVSQTIQLKERGNSGCKVNGCERKHFSKGYCSAHYKQVNEHGKIMSATINVSNPRDVEQGCKVDGCNRKHGAKGYCSAHYNQMYCHGKITSEKIRVNKGIFRRNDGYVVTLRYDHSMADKKGWVKRANLVWEENTGHIVKKGEIVHHKNGDRSDDSFKNLELFKSNSEHVKRRHSAKGVQGLIKGGVIK